MKKKAYTIIATIALGVVVSLTHAQQQNRSDGQQPNPGDSEITAKLEQLVGLRQKILEGHELLVQAGRVPDDGSAAMKLAEARIELALERGGRQEILKEITGLVTVHKERLNRLQSRADQLAPAEIDQAKASLIEAEVRLLKARR